MKQNKTQKGFTLIELLIVIAIIAIIAAVAFVALNPLQRFRDARDSRRWADISAVLSALKVSQVDNRGSYITAVNNLTASDTAVYMIGVETTGCNAGTCTTAVASSGACVDLSGLVTDGYLASVPISPDGAGSWDASTTGYTLAKKTNGTIVIRSCENENTGEIMVAR